MNDQAEQKLIVEIVAALRILNKFSKGYPLENRGENSLNLPDCYITSEVSDFTDPDGTLIDRSVMFTVTENVNARTSLYNFEFHFWTGDGFSPIRAAWTISKTLNAVDYSVCEPGPRCFNDITEAEICSLEKLWEVGIIGLQEEPVLEEAA